MFFKDFMFYMFGYELVDFHTHILGNQGASAKGLGVRLVFEVFEELHKFVVWEAFARAPNSFAERAMLLCRLLLLLLLLLAAGHGAADAPAVGEAQPARPLRCQQ